MKVKFSPIHSDHDTRFRVIDENTVEIDGETYFAPQEIVNFYAIGPILEASRDSTGELSMTVMVSYSIAKAAIWETPPYRGSNYETMNPGDAL